MQRKIRVLVGKPGLDGHDRGAKVVAAALRDAGMEVIYTGLHQTPEQVVEAAIQEDVDVVALSILSGAHMTLFPEIRDQLRERGVGDKLITGGGIIPAEDMKTLADSGVGRLFGPGSSTQDIVHYIREWFAARHGADALTPLPPPPVRQPLVETMRRPAPRATPKRAAAKPRRATPKPKRAAPKRATPKSKRKVAAPRRAKPAPKRAKAKPAAKRGAPKRAAARIPKRTGKPAKRRR